MEQKTLQTLDQQLRICSQAYRRVKVALNALQGFSSLGTNAGNESIAFALRELQSAIGAFNDKFSTFAQAAEDLSERPE